MLLRRWCLLVGSGVAILALGSRFGVPTRAAERHDPANGVRVAAVCLSCHAAELTIGQPPYHVPRLYGQNAAYLIGAMRAYAGNARNNAVMHAQAVALSPQDWVDVSTYFAGERAKPPPANSSGSVPDTVVEICSACHGETGLSSMPEVPVLSGQHADYLELALGAYATGERKNAVMPAFARELTPSDRAEIAAYFSRLGVLRTEQ